MCGIWGLLSLEEIAKNYDLGLLYNKFNQIKSRGPDRSIWIQNPNYIVGFHRLSIMDLSVNGDQPFAYSCNYTDDFSNNILRTIYVCVNGEIYNWKKLKSDPELVEFCSQINFKYKSESDCEVILPLFLQFVNSQSYEKSNSQYNLFTTGLITTVLNVFKNGIGNNLVKCIDDSCLFNMSTIIFTNGKR